VHTHIDFAAETLREELEPSLVVPDVTLFNKDENSFSVQLKSPRGKKRETDDLILLPEH
jgi:hypothetical protein